MILTRLPLVGLILLAPQVHAAGFFLPNQNAEATARGNAWAATADSPAAVHYNPAGLTQIENTTAELGVYGIQLGNEVENASGDFRADTEWQPIPSLFFAQPLQNDFTLGLGVHAPFGLGTDWGNDTPFRQVTTEAEIINIRASAVLGYQVNEQLSLGAGVSMNYADASLTQGILPFNPAAPSDDFVRFDGNDIAYSWMIGVLWKPHPKHSFAAVYRSEADYQLTGDLEGTPGFPLPFGDASLDIITPASATVGWAWQVTPRLNLEINVEWIEWDRFNSLDIETPGGNLPSQRFDWESTFIYEIGASYQISDHWTCHLGYDFNEGAQPDEFYNPALADADRHWINAGLTYHGHSYEVQLGYQFGFSDHEVTESVIGTNGDYSARHHAFQITTVFEF